jgi:hypothetical protein
MYRSMFAHNANQQLQVSSTRCDLNARDVERKLCKNPQMLSVGTRCLEARAILVIS